MCGIAGYAGDFPGELLDSMGERLAQRGPDGSGRIALLPRGPGSAPVGLAHRRLSIIDLSEAGRQPMTVDCGEGLEGHAADLPYARLVARHLGADLHEIEIGPEVILELPTLIHILDEPQADPAPVNSLLIARQARKDGIKVLLSGQGGDDVLTGYRRHRALWPERYWGGLPRGLRREVAAPSRRIFEGRGPIPGVDGARLRQFARGLAHAELPADERLVAWFSWGGEFLRRSPYTADFSSKVEHLHTGAPLLRSLARIPEEREPIHRMLYLEAKHFLADHNLNYTDRTGMAAGISRSSSTG
jgi:asparagine synthase (glutamine-hydrolysing)